MGGNCVLKRKQQESYFAGLLAHMTFFGAGKDTGNGLSP